VEQAARPAELDLRAPGTAAEVYRVWTASYRLEAELLGVENFPPLARSEEQIARSDNLFFGVFAAGELAAVAEVELASSEAATIAALVVHPDHFRQGHAGALVRDILRRFGDRAVEVSTAVANKPALALYRTLGFAENRRWSTEGAIPMVTTEGAIPMVRLVR
jgi:ribosomal protein S18 acetylase RimI-like enzyme